MVDGALHLPNSQKATQTLGSAPENDSLNLSRNIAQDEAGEPGRGKVILMDIEGAYLVIDGSAT